MDVALLVDELDGLDQLAHVEARLRLTEDLTIDQQIHQIAT